MLEIIPISDFLLITFILTFASVLQASTGMASGIIVVPLLALIRIDFIPGPIIFSSLFLTSLMAIRDRKDIYFSKLPWFFLGIFLGSIFVMSFIDYFQNLNLSLLYGFIILIAIIMSAKGFHISLNAKNTFGVGIVSSIMGITASVGGIVVALYYQRLSGKQIRGTLGFCYFFGAFMMMIILNRYDRFAFKELSLGLYLIPGMVLGFLLAPLVSKYLDRGYSRIAVIIISLISSMILILKGFLSS